MKKLLIILILILTAGAVSFADDSDYYPRTAITLDALPALASIFVTAALNDTVSIQDYALLTALQLEFNITRKLSLAGRIGIRWFNLDDLDLKSTSFEGHLRFYPTGKTFFMDGMVGYNHFKMTGRVDHDLLIFGAKIGWRADFGRPGGFIIEPSIGYNGVLGLQDDFSNEESYMKFLIQQYLVGGLQIGVCMGVRF